MTTRLSAFRPRGLALGGAALLMLWGSARPALAQSAPGLPEAPGSEAAPPPAPASPPVEQPPASPPPPEAPPPAPTTTDAAADAAAAAALASASAGTQGETEGYKLNLYGFTDFTFTKFIDTGSFGSPVSTFAVGNFNLYMGSELGDNWRTLGEVRFSYLPNGTIPSAQAFSPTPPPPTDTTVPDYTDLGRPVQWGSVIIERVYIERTFLSWLTVRAGHFLTPFGIWNVDHGSPVIVGVRRPYIVGESLFPLHQTGLEGFGSGLVGPVEVGYHLTLSNGRGPTDTYKDMDGNKAIGWRLWGRLNTSLAGTFSLGFSGYRGQFTNANATSTYDPVKGTFTPGLMPTLQYDELSLAGDLKWERGGALFQAETVMNDVAYTAAAPRPVAFAFDGGPPGFTPDNRRWGAYALGGYRFDFYGIMPWFGGEYYNLGKQSSNVAAVWGGLNVRPTPRVVLKLQITKSFWLQDLGGLHFDGVFLTDFQVAWSF